MKPSLSSEEESEEQFLNASRHKALWQNSELSLRRSKNKVHGSVISKKHRRHCNCCSPPCVSQSQDQVVALILSKEYFEIGITDY